jgi:hypothetical protein
MLPTSRIHNGAVGQRLDAVVHLLFIVFLRGQMSARRGIARRHGARGRGRMATGGAQDLIFGAGAMQRGFQALVV